MTPIQNDSIVLSVSQNQKQVAQNGFAIRDFRIKAKMSVDELAARVGCSAPHMRNIENEHRSASDEDLNRIADVVDCRPQSIRRQPLAVRAPVAV